MLDHSPDIPGIALLPFASSAAERREAGIASRLRTN